ncbi:MAG TPA: gamma-glutamyl-gamma-aminobutyrate hydrolase family protein [Geminicoccaceae bacterium]|nr:gamma-glutamyl-gamma-aminobutyrate hydrolase family protein [Geminicoccaceae bacterium]
MDRISRPVIGVTLDSEQPGGYSKLPWYALRQNYFSAIVRAGGVPVALPHEPECVTEYLDMIDGLLVSGGAFDVDPALYGADARHGTVTTKDRRTRFEWAITRAAVAADKPVLGICGGQQLLNVVLGGTLIQHIPDSVAGCLEHEQKNPRTEPGHDVRIERGTLLHRITGADRLPVNSAHHQAAEVVPEGVVVSARAADGVVEAIEAPDRRFCLGVQWHPEYDVSPGDTALVRAFVDACRGAR